MKLKFYENLKITFHNKVQDEKGPTNGVGALQPKTFSTISTIYCLSNLLLLIVCS